MTERMNGNIEVSGVTIYYKLCSDCNEVDGTINWTEFFTQEGLKPEKEWSWRKFRMIPTGRQIPNYIKRFSLPYWITESTHLTKSELRKKLERQVELINRAQELERGEFV